MQVKNDLRCLQQIKTQGIYTLYTVDATEYVTAQIDATFHEVSEECKTVS